MALDRTWYNALVDDDGSNTVGTVWGKDDIKNLLDSVDAEFTRTTGGIAFGSWVPVLAADGGGTPVVSGQAGFWSRADKLFQFQGRITLSSKGTLSGGLSITGLTSYVPASAGAVQVGFYSGLIAGINWVGMYYLASGSTLNLSYSNAGGTTLQLGSAQLGAGAVDLIFGGTMRVL